MAVSHEYALPAAVNTAYKTMYHSSMGMSDRPQTTYMDMGMPLQTALQ